MAVSTCKIPRQMFALVFGPRCEAVQGRCCIARRGSTDTGKEAEEENEGKEQEVSKGKREPKWWVTMERETNY